ncbi:MAG: GTPase Era [Sphingomonas sp.]|nr:GTPase Era [Sphingomonas sp.]
MTKCGLVAVLGAPNAGKSTLVNALVGQKVAITSPKAQTTRTRLMGIATHDDVQILLLDTPGIFSPGRRLDRAMVKAAWEGAEDADRVLVMIDAAASISKKTQMLLDGVANRPEPKILVINKTDIANKRELLVLAQSLSDQLDPEAVFFISATTGEGVDDLKQHLAGCMPEGPWHFPEDQLSDATDRMIAAEFTREQLYNQLHQELPYASAVVTEKWEERPDGSTAIHQQIRIARDSQKGIVLGKGGSKLKSIGEAARKEIAEHLGRKVHLFLHVKVDPKWDEDREIYEEVGLDWSA